VHPPMLKKAAQTPCSNEKARGVTRRPDNIKWVSELPSQACRGHIGTAFLTGYSKRNGGQTPLRCNRPTPLELRNMSNRRNLEPRLVELLAQAQDNAGLLE
jgi:hypothetical protein